MKIIQFSTVGFQRVKMKAILVFPIIFLREIYLMLKYRLLEIDIDGAFKSMLLLKKKKYAALTAEKKGDQIVTKEEFKGLDIVRRDWSNIARSTGEEILRILLHETEEDIAIERIHDHLELG